METLGSVTVICSDKTGTLTQNRMTVTVLDLVDRRVELGRHEDPHANAGAVTPEDPHANAGGDGGSTGRLGPEGWLVLAGGSLCSDAVLAREENGLETIGDPTEGALVAAAARAGLRKPALERLFPRIGELPFDSERKRMTTVHEVQAGEPVRLPARVAGWLERSGAEAVYFTKGAVDSLLEVSASVWSGGRVRPLDDSLRARIREANDELASRGIRVLGVAVKAGTLPAGDQGDWERDLAFVGMAGMLDPLRPEAERAVRICRQAGIRPVMITGDHPLIARTIGRELGLGGTDRFLTGADLERRDAPSLAEEVEEVSVYARVSPEHKLKIVDALQARGHIVAMTGDGVNDAPALKSADIGVAMGVTGTDVSREAADMVLQDDNFSTIVAAVEEGRIIFDNIVRFVRYILASNWAEILVMLVAPLLGMPLPLFPVQILWMNLVTDGLPALALGVEPGEADVMRRPPRRPDLPILTMRTGTHVLWVGLLMAAAALAVGALEYGLTGAGAGPGRGDAGASVWRTMLFTTLVFSQLTLALAERSTTYSLFRTGLLSNPSMLAAVTGTFALQMAVVYLPFAQGIFKTVPLASSQAAVCLAVSLVMLLAVEVEKLLRRGRRPAGDRTLDGDRTLAAGRTPAGESVPAGDRP